MTKSKSTFDLSELKLDIKKPDPQHECGYCHRKFSKESSLATHLCEQKKRYQSKGDPGSRIGFLTYNKFYDYTQPNCKGRSFDDFAKSAYYRAFVKFGWFVSNTKPIHPERFIEWVIKQNKKLDYWCSDKLYGEFLHYWIRHEPVEDALERAIRYAIDWGTTHDAPFNDMLRYGSPNGLCQAVSNGRISPWVLYSCASGQELLGKFNEEQISIVWSMIDPEFWTTKLSDCARDWKHAKRVLGAAGW